MCGRYSLQTKRVDLARELALSEDDVLELAPRWNVAPSQPVPVLLHRKTPDGTSRPGMAMRVWGLVPYWAKDPRVGSRHINARRETLATLPTFRDSFHDGRRCLVVADGFYEWAPIRPGGPRMPHYIRLHGGGPFTFAGLWARWRSPEGEPLETCTIITGPPNELVRELHDRMPVILPVEAREAWIDPATRDERELLALLDVFPADAMETYPVSKHVNSPDHDDAACVEPLAPEAAAAAEERGTPPRKRRRVGGSSGDLDLFGGA